MGRFLMYTALGALAVFVLSATFVLEIGGRRTEANAETSIHDILLQPDAYQGKVVTTEGVLREGDSDDEFLVTDSESLGIIVRYESAPLRVLEGQAVTVTGIFGFDDETGVFIEAGTVRSVQ